jgi:predicted dehydrogenase
MSEMLHWGIVSTANIGVRKVIPATQKAERCEVVAIASRDGERAAETATELGIPRAHEGYEALLADPEVDAVYIPLPNSEHAEWTIAAARAGKHVLCEKPLAMTAAKAEEMVRACATEGVLLMEAFMYRLHPSWESVRELVASGRIGGLRAVQSWFSYFNDDPRNIRNVPELGGGALYDIGCYCINLSRMLFGAEPTAIEASVTRDETGTDVLTSAILAFDAGVATFTCSTRAEPDQRAHILRDRGPDLHRHPVQHPAGSSDGDRRDGGRRSAGQPRLGDAHVRHGEPVHDPGGAVRGRRARRSSASDPP